MNRKTYFNFKNNNFLFNPNTGEKKELIIYNGPRDETFKNLLFNILKSCNLKSHYLDIITDDESLKIFNNVFTSASANIDFNYEIYEQLGDVSTNKFLVWYFYKRFPQLFHPKYVKVVARLRINMVSKQTFASIADSLGFWDFLTASDMEREHCKKPLLEDVFEAFIGAVEYIVDHRLKQGAGYAIISQLLTTIFDKIPISLKYEDLYDAKTRLKELFDFYGQNVLGTFSFNDIHNSEEKLFTSTVYQIRNNGQKIKIGEGKSSLKIDSQINASSNALQFLSKLGYIKEIPELYKNF
jgi:dsRNA-specific ribonuclease